MDLPVALLRLLEVSCANDSVKNWSIFEERDGCYTFKIRFVQNKDRHIEYIEGTGSPAIPSSPIGNTVFKRKSPKQVERDNERSKAYQDRIMNRSQTAKQSSGTVQNSVEDNQSVTNITPVKPSQPSPSEIVKPSPNSSLTLTTSCNLESKSATPTPQFEHHSRKNFWDNSCHSRFCAYGKPPYIHPSRDIDRFEAFCSNSECQGGYLCFMCLDRGRHSRHRQFIKKFPPT